MADFVEEFQEIASTYQNNKLLLHSCCAPCSGSMMKILIDLGIQVTILWYNPNIHPKKEYEIRKQENVKYAQFLKIPFIDLDYDSKEWFHRAKGMEYDPERGHRCTMCFDMRMERTALYAYEHGFHHFTTTNATSRWKDIEQVNASGRKAASRYSGLFFWEYNWQTNKLTKLKYEISASHFFYKQEYCGCLYSLRDTNLYRQSQSLPNVVIGKGGVFSDPVADAEEENQEVIDAFFKEAQVSFNNKKLKELYASRKKQPTIVLTSNPLPSNKSSSDDDSGSIVDKKDSSESIQRDIDIIPRDLVPLKILTLEEINNW